MLELLLGHNSFLTNLRTTLSECAFDEWFSSFKVRSNSRGPNSVGQHTLQKLSFKRFLSCTKRNMLKTHRNHFQIKYINISHLMWIDHGIFLQLSMLWYIVRTTDLRSRNNFQIDFYHRKIKFANVVCCLLTTAIEKSRWHRQSDLTEANLAKPVGL